MDAGRIVERGSHLALLAADGRYARMWRLQNAQRREPGATDADGAIEDRTAYGNPLA
jgi:ATP-binding cassette subfamily B protein